eukprot:TRINITY_DN48380_c0_g1_i1.p1 TRINITY_DN48380_c0_g1~~TRINITY_DN48380_c0_g1_i1.p1  ORF type:complete len:218 (+),score=47.87 TRINITY_DN48380_c0_g1_i1:126-779(+)
MDDSIADGHEDTGQAALRRVVVELSELDSEIAEIEEFLRHRRERREGLRRRETALRRLFASGDDQNDHAAGTSASRGHVERVGSGPRVLDDENEAQLTPSLSLPKSEPSTSSFVMGDTGKVDKKNPSTEKDEGGVTTKWQGRFALNGSATCRVEDWEDGLEALGVAKCGLCGQKFPLNTEAIEAHSLVCESEAAAANAANIQSASDTSANAAGAVDT